MNRCCPPCASTSKSSWPFRAQRLTVVDGALDALSRIVDQIVGLGDRVVMESPGFPPLIDMLDRAGAEIIPVAMDEQGMFPNRTHPRAGRRLRSRCSCSRVRKTPPALP